MIIIVSLVFQFLDLLFPTQFLYSHSFVVAEYIFNYLLATAMFDDLTSMFEDLTCSCFTRGLPGESSDAVGICHSSEIID